jgi:hypothetical protein
MASIAQKLYDWADKYREWDGNGWDTWKPGPVGWFAKRMRAWVYRHFDVVPF